MGIYCYVRGCNTTQYKSRNYDNKEHIPCYGFPTNPELRKKWCDALQILNNQDVTNIPKKARICIHHFEKDDIEQSGFSHGRLKPNRIPSKFPHTCETSNIENAEVQPEEIATCSITPSAEKKLRYPGDVKIEELQNGTLELTHKAIQVLKNACKKKDQCIKRLQKQQPRQKRKIESLERLLAELKEQGLISSNSANTLQAISEETTIIKEIERGKINGKFSPQLRAFALTINFYSPKAYNYIRSTFKNQLPAPSTIRSWYGSTNGSPGFSTEAIEILKRKCEASGGKKLYACLSMDEMAIRRQIEWSQSEHRFVGYVDHGLIIEEQENLLIAKDALVYLLTGINQRWKIPVAYFLVNGLTSEELATITKEVLRFVARSGIITIALTFDGLPANVSMCAGLGANIFPEKTYFSHPSQNHEVLIFFDAAHMLKLVRNAFAKHILYDADENPIEFKYLQLLNNMQEAGHFHLANKITAKHMEWWKNAMSVKLAAQTLSESCAVSLEQLSSDGNPQFIGCAATAKYCRMMNNIFDCLNSRTLCANGFKKPLSKENATQIIEFCEEAENYLLTIKVGDKSTFTKKPIIESKLKTGFIGLTNDLRNLKRMYKTYVDSGELKYILSYKLSQDHLEILFSCFRSMGGFNNNPTAMQFAASFKRLLNHNEVRSSTAANCIPQDETSILTVSSSKTPQKNLDIIELEEKEKIEIDDIPLRYIDATLNHATQYIEIIYIYKELNLNSWSAKVLDFYGNQPLTHAKW